MQALDWAAGIATLIGFAMGFWVGWRKGYSRGYERGGKDAMELMGMRRNDSHISE